MSNCGLRFHSRSCTNTTFAKEHCRKNNKWQYCLMGLSFFKFTGAFWVLFLYQPFFYIHLAFHFSWGPCVFIKADFHTIYKHPFGVTQFILRRTLNVKKWKRKKGTHSETNLLSAISVDVWRKRYSAATPSTRK